ncbi:MAG: L-lactate permease [Anaerolineae bacterium]|jgi:lactate permease|nr:L-lactate permease [Anaerolineae bacterium]MBT7072126.1 L-lactate permease [Anaerolineae bacterium]MBT7326775.1 L-lactate permease [Anaerolineae bacterium]
MPLLATLPILIILLLMVGYRWGAARAGAAGYLAALVVAVAFFGANAEVLAYAHTRAILLTFDVLFIIWAAYLLYRVSDEAGAIETIGEALRQLTSDKGMQAILIGWIFASFLQGTGGFGVPVAITAPLLIGLGFSPLAAVVIPTIGHGWAVTFGSLGSSFNALISTTGLEASYLAPASAGFLGLAVFPVGLMVVHAADGWGAVKRLAWKVLLIGAVMGGTQYFVGVTLGLWNIGSFAGGMAGLIVGVPLARWDETNSISRERIGAKPLFIALSAYLLLIVITASILLIPSVNPLKDALGEIAIRVSFPETVSNLSYINPEGTTKPIYIFKHTGAILLYTSAAAFVIYKRAGLYAAVAGKKILSQTARKMITSSLSIALMVAMAVVMQQSGMTEALAQGLANAVGTAFPFAAAWIGALGAFMTGSNTNSNVVFAALQLRTAELLGYSVPIILAAQTAGASLGSVLAPAKLIVGASTAGMEGKEGVALRAVIGYGVGLIFFISSLTVLAIIF